FMMAPPYPRAVEPWPKPALSSSRLIRGASDLSVKRLSVNGGGLFSSVSGLHRENVGSLGRAAPKQIRMTYAAFAECGGTEVRSGGDDTRAQIARRTAK